MCFCIPQHSKVYLKLINTLRKVVYISSILPVLRSLLDHTIPTELSQKYEAIGAVAWKHPMVGTTTTKGFIEFYLWFTFSRCSFHKT